MIDCTPTPYDIAWTQNLVESIKTAMRLCLDSVERAVAHTDGFLLAEVFVGPKVLG